MASPIAEVWMQRGDVNTLIRSIIHEDIKVAELRAIAFAKLQARLDMSGAPDTWAVFWVEVHLGYRDYTAYTSTEDTSLNKFRAYHDKV